MNIQIDRKALLDDIQQRVEKNKRGVLSYLESAGVPVADERITLKHLRDLQRLNPDSFAELVQYLYPEKVRKASADGDNIDKGSSWGASDWVGMVGTVLGGASSIISNLNINGNTSAQANAAAYAAMAAEEQAQAEKKQMRKTILIVCAGFVIVVVAAIFIFKNRR